MEGNCSCSFCFAYEIFEPPFMDVFQNLTSCCISSDYLLI
uniref:Uncharacterized protein n=1 Tax=Rhizophora mucronata TaxID=61149 RepID=A0A2P2NA02_RHIMU